MNGLSGPPYPPPPTSAIGEFQIGVSPIGSQPTLDYWNTIISQYANSPRITQIIANFWQYVDQQTITNIDNFFDFMWNVETAQGYGLDVWGRVVGISRVVPIQQSLQYLQFEESTNPGTFGQFPFYAGVLISNNFILADDAFRLLIMAKAATNITDGSIKSINQLLLNLFPGRGNVFVIDGLNMTMTYQFNFHLSDAELVIVNSPDALPHPTGVAVSVVSQ